MLNSEDFFGALLGRLLDSRPELADWLKGEVDPLPEYWQGLLWQGVKRFPARKGIGELIAEAGTALKIPDLLSADDILQTEWPEQNWVVSGLVPVGLTILAGRPKAGKSWLALQMAHAVASCGEFLGQSVSGGRVLYMALEDSPQRLRSRMQMQDWPAGLGVDFLTLGKFGGVGGMLQGGADKLTELIINRQYRLVILDTFSRVLKGDQLDQHQMNDEIGPMQAIGHDSNCALLAIDHHKKPGALEPDVIADVMGSTSKGAVADCIWGLYKERGKRGARLMVTGRDMEDTDFNIEFCDQTKRWKVDPTLNNRWSELQTELLNTLEEMQAATARELATNLGRNPGTVHRQLVELEKEFAVAKDGDRWKRS